MEFFQKIDSFYQLLAASALGGLAVKLLDVVWDNYVSEWFEKRKLSSSDKRAMADAIIKLCAEGNASEYKKLPEDEKSIYVLINQLESLGSPVSGKLAEFHSLWITVHTLVEFADISEGRDFLNDMIKETDKQRKLLLRAVGKWKK